MSRCFDVAQQNSPRQITSDIHNRPAHIQNSVHANDENHPGSRYAEFRRDCRENSNANPRMVLSKELGLAVMMYIRFPLSLRNVEDLFHEQGIDITHETVRSWWNRFGPMFAAQIRKTRIQNRNHSNWAWHLDEVLVKISGELHYLWRAVDHEGEVLEAYVTRRRGRHAALRFLPKAMKRYGNPKAVVTDRLKSYKAAMKVIGNAGRQETGRWPNNRAENSHLPVRRKERAMGKFCSFETLQKFASTQSSVHNHFSHERHLSVNSHKVVHSG